LLTVSLQIESGFAVKVLVACEFTGIVAKAFRDRGHEAWSCDLKPSEQSEWHINGDVRFWLDRGGWDLMIANARIWR
jgi:hypothetical protein